MYAYQNCKICHKEKKRKSVNVDKKSAEWKSQRGK